MDRFKRNLAYNFIIPLGGLWWWGHICYITRGVKTRFHCVKKLYTGHIYGFGITLG
jgi:hypothetical protein